MYFIIALKKYTYLVKKTCNLINFSLKVRIVDNLYARNTSRCKIAYLCTLLDSTSQSLNSRRDSNQRYVSRQCTALLLSYQDPFLVSVFDLIFISQFCLSILSFLATKRFFLESSVKNNYKCFAVIKSC